jgi:hypothetical protein
MRKTLLLAWLLVLPPASALAASDVVATYTYADGTMMTLCTRDAGHVRMDTSATSYMLLKDNKVYAVSRADDGSWQVMDMDDAGSMGAGVMSMFGGGSPPIYDIRYEKTARKEKVAGYTGAVYEALIFEDGKAISRDEVVLSSDSSIKKLGDGWIAMAAHMSRCMGQQMAKSVEQCAREAGKMGYGGMLRYGNQMRMKSLKVTSLAAAYYELPASAQRVGTPGSAARTDDAGLGDDAREVGLDAKEATKDELKEGVRSVIGSIFD